MKKYNNILIIGGGQLGMMMAESVSKYNVSINVIDPNIFCSARKFVDQVIVADFDDEATILSEGKKADVISYEFENIDERLLTSFSAKLPQGVIANEISKNRFIEKTFFKQLGFKTAAFSIPTSIKDIKKEYTNKAILKTIVGGYDGKGQYLIKDNDFSEVEKLDFKSNKYILEQFIDFDFEISIVATRDKFNNTFGFPITKNIHRSQILSVSICEHKYQKYFKEAEALVTKIMEKLNYVGTLCVELFVVGSKLIINEMAPRPHNSGHITQESCDVSQFEQHMKAILGFKINRPKLLSESYMINLIGDEIKHIEQFDNKYIYSHNYYKDEVRLERKMGHINILNKQEFDKLSKIIKGETYE